MSQADLAQLTAQRAQDEFNIVQAESNVKNYKRQLKEILQITSEEAFDIAIPSTTDQMALASIPGMNSVYTAALQNRPEFLSYQNQLDRTIWTSRLQRQESCQPSAQMQELRPAPHP